MTPVMQTHLGGPEATIVGNCMQAAVASLLDLELDDVPHFVQESTEPWDAFARWLYPAEVVEVDGDTQGELLVFGPTRGGTHHWVIYRDGQLAHDPAGGDGLFYAERFYTIVRNKGATV